MTGQSGRNRAARRLIRFFAGILLALLCCACRGQDAFTLPDAEESAAMRKQTPSRILSPERPGPVAWLCYYGADRNVLTLPDYRLLLLEADALGTLTAEDKEKRLCVAYMSIGEISQNRWFWPLVEGKDWLLAENPDWPGARRIDPHSPEWADILVTRVAPALIAAGYDGFMLDNVDTGEFLEATDPARFAGAREAVAGIIRRLREAFPEAVIIANGGLETAAEAADLLDAVVCESAFSRWKVNEDGQVSYEELSPGDRAWLRPRLMRVRATGLPVLSLDYVAPEDTEGAREIAEAATKAGYHPYLAERELMRLPAGGAAGQHKAGALPSRGRP